MKHKFPFNAIVLAAGVLAVGGTAIGLATHPGGRLPELPDVPHGQTPVGEATLLPNGWQVTPVGQSIPLMGDLPLAMQITPDGKYLLVTTSGYHNQSINAISLADNKVVQGIDLQTTFYGLALSPDGSSAYVATGGVPAPRFRRLAAKPGQNPKEVAIMQPVMRLPLDNGRLGEQIGVPIASIAAGSRFITGLASSSDGALFVADYADNSVYKLAGPSLAAAASGAVGNHPYALALSPDQKILAVTNWADATVSLLDSQTLETKALVPVGNHPNALAWAKDGRLLVTNAGANSVSVIAGSKVVETVKTSLSPSDPVGSTPDAVVVSPDGTRAYVANADNNDVAVLDISNPSETRIAGFIPTGWYPSSLAISRDGKRLYIGIGKGLQFTPNVNDQTKLASVEQVVGYKYIGACLSGAVSVVDAPGDQRLAEYTRQVIANTPKPLAGVAAAARVSAETAFSHIKHIVYIIRENRTYDQVFGDIPQGNGDSNICVFGKNVTPNAHALAANYVLLDNLYCNGEVSEDGHQWCDAAYATDFTERHWPNNYSHRPAPEGDDDMSQSPAGYLWDNCAAHGVTYMNYGERSRFTSSPGEPPVFKGPQSLVGHASVPYGLIPNFAEPRDVGRARIFIDDLHKADASGHWPQLMVMALPEDHTQALRAGAFTPRANVGENDLALGKIVDAVSHSRFWPETAIFVIEDDAQNGADHVDAHRTVGLVISPYIRKGVDSTMYTTASFVRTMELILGLPPMTQFDRNATPLYNSFAPAARLEAFDCRAPGVDVTARNPTAGVDESASDKLDLSAPDRADPDKMNAILWHALKPGVPMPAPVRSARLDMARGGGM